MGLVLEIGFKGNRKEYFSNPLQFPFRIGDYAIVEADRGEDLGVVLQVGILASLKGIEDENALKKILRKPNPQDLTRYEENRALERDAFGVCKEKIEHHHLNMKLVDVEYQYDRNKLTFYFTAERRVDFRELVKDLASVYRTRIELRQIGVRDEARRLGGYGPCGRQLCCTSFLMEFDPITTQFAKEQNLPLNPTKLSGVCGRLKCCLRFEQEFYQQANRRFPNVGTKIQTPEGVGVVERIDILKEEIYLKVNGEGVVRFSMDEISNLILQDSGEKRKKRQSSKKRRSNR
jgi:cell fate regulator YaaT (PSP1 superfamily)